MLILDRQFGRSTEIFDAFVQSLRQGNAIYPWLAA